MFQFLSEFFNDASFNRGVITIYSRSITYQDGIAVHGAQTSRIVKSQKVIIPLSTKDLQDRGLGEFIENSAYELYVKDKNKFTFSNGTLLTEGDLIGYNSDMYKIVSILDYKTHGFYKYTIVKFKDVALND